MRYMVDLYSGLGGASEAMMISPKWEVLRIENNPLLADVPNTVMMDCRKLVGQVKQQSGFERIDLLWASIPCTEFSEGYNGPLAKAQRNGTIDSYQPCLKDANAVRQIIDTVQPKYWVVENVKGSLKYLEPIFGKVRQIVGPYYLYGNFPFFDLDPSSIIPKSMKDSWSTDPLRQNKKAKVDLLLSMRLRDAIESQKSILDYTRGG